MRDRFSYFQIGSICYHHDELRVLKTFCKLTLNHCKIATYITMHPVIIMIKMMWRNIFITYGRTVFSFQSIVSHLFLCKRGRMRSLLLISGAAAAAVTPTEKVTKLLVKLEQKMQDEGISVVIVQCDQRKFSVI